MANWFSSASIFILVFVTCAQLIYGLNITVPALEFVRNQNTAFDYISRTVQDPTTFALIGISITTAVITGNIIALSIPLISVVINFFMPIAGIFNAIFAVAALPPELAILPLLLSALMQFFLLVAGIILLRGLVVF